VGVANNCTTCENPTLADLVKCGHADVRIFGPKMTKPKYKPNTKPNSNPNVNPNTKQTLILI